MRIGIDCTVMARPVTGFETYVSCLASALVRLKSDAELVLFSPRPLPPDLATLRGCATIITSPFGTQVLAHQAWLASTRHVHRVDLMHYPAFPPLLPPSKFVMTVHDATPWKFARTMSAKARIYFRSTLALWTRRSRLIITPSESSKEEIADRFGVPDSRVRVIHHGVRNSLRPRSQDASGDPPPRRRSEPEYILFVGTVEPRKNLSLLIRAIAKLRATGQSCRLVVAGRLAWGVPEIERLLDREGVNDGVELRGHVSDAELAGLYERAVCLVQPSLHEGFGYPIAEAMALGCPVIASRIPPYVEVLGEAGVYISPHDVDGLAAAISQMLGNEEFRAALIARALARSEEFTWRRSAERTLEAYRDAITS
jgi:glycosyltransferase involved in cell wall biosynthesis